MAELDDHELLAEFAKNESETAFGGLVARYVNLVYSAALRFTRNPHHAEEITQAVFIILARKARSLPRGVVLGGWLYQAARLTAANFLRGEVRRQQREQEAYMQSTFNGPDAVAWEQIAPLLDEAMRGLGDTDRNAVVLRFFQNKTAAEAASALKLTEAATHKRTNRALEKLRAFFGKRGVTLSAALIAAAVSAGSVQAAPAGLQGTIVATAIKGTAISATLTTLIKATMKTMTWLKLKFALGATVVALIAAGGASVAISQNHPGEKFTAQQILQKSKNAYAALTSYSDEGTSASTVGTNSVAPHVFSIRMARPNLYRIQWKQDSGFFVSTGLVWSAGHGDFQQTTAVPPRQERDMQEAFSNAAGISGGSTMSVPAMVFDINTRNQLPWAMQNATRLPDEKIGRENCYVLTRSSGERITTIWIGKRDLLIRQIQHDTSAAGLKATLNAEAKKRRQFPTPVSNAVLGDSQSIETHTKIAVDQPFTEKDFAP
jgi:RNA polymerase sigma factor (sigma-70 family)